MERFERASFHRERFEDGIELLEGGAESLPCPGDAGVAPHHRPHIIGGDLGGLAVAVRAYYETRTTPEPREKPYQGSRLSDRHAPPGVWQIVLPDPKPFRFGVQCGGQFDRAGWEALARKIEDVVLWRPAQGEALTGTPNKWVRSGDPRG